MDPRKSPLYGKRTEVSCVDKNDLLETNLKNGRKCLENYQCMSRNCDWSTGICMGKFANQTCSTHADCNAGLFCSYSNATKSSMCIPQLSEGKQCKDEYECQNNMGCV